MLSDTSVPNAIVEETTTSNDSVTLSGTLVGKAMGFTAPNGGLVVNQVDWMLRQASSPDGTVVARIYTNTGTRAAVVVDTLVASSTTSLDPTTFNSGLGDWETFNFVSVFIPAGEYAVAVERVSDTTGSVLVNRNNIVTSGGFDGDARSATEDPDGTWASATNELLFRVYATKGQVFKPGALLRKSSGSVLFEIEDTDPTNIFGIADEGAADAQENEYVMATELDSTHWYGMMGTRDPVSGDVGTEYGLVKSASGHWIVDITDTSNTRVEVAAVDTVQNYYFVTFLSAHIQS